MAEPALSEVHADLVGRLKHDERLRNVEQEQAAQSATMAALRDEIRAMRLDAKTDKAEVLAAIEANRPKSPWPAVSAMAAVLAVVLVVAAALYGQA